MTTILEIVPVWKAALATAGLSDFDSFMRVQGGPPTGWHRHRETIPLDLTIDGAAKRFFLKRVFRVPPKHAFWPRVRGRPNHSQPRREWHMLIHLERAGIPAMKRVAFGERRQWGLPTQAFILVEAVPIEYTLENWLLPGFPKPPPIDKRLRDHLIYELGLLCAQLNQAGFHWPDLAAKHIFAAPLAEPAGRHRWEFRLIDVERMTRSLPSLLPRAGRHEEVSSRFAPLMHLVEDFALMNADRWDILRLLAGARLRIAGDSAPRGKGPRLSTAALARQPFLAELQRRGSVRLPDGFLHPACRETVLIDDMVVERASLPLLRDAGFDRFDAVFHEQAGGRMRKPGLPSHRERIRLEIADEQGNRRIWFVKRYSYPPGREQWQRIREWRARSSSAAREAHYIRKLGQLGLSAPKVIACGERMRGCLERRSLLITEEIAGRSLETLAQEILTGQRSAPSPAERREIIQQLAQVVARLHGNHLYHRDLYLCHVFMTRNADGGIVLHLIDLARMIARPWRSVRWQIKDLAALAYSAPAALVTRGDRLRFLYHYLHAPRGVPATALRRWRAECRPLVRLMIRRIQARAARMARHDRQRQRRLKGNPSA